MRACYDRVMNEGRAKEQRDALELIARFGAALSNRGIALDNHGIFTAASAMTLALNQDERSQYFKCLAALGRIAYDQPAGDETLRQLLDQTLLAAIDGPPEGSEQRIATAVEDLKRDLFAPATDFSVAYRIQWIDESELPFRYQHVQLIPVDPAMLSATLLIRTGGHLDDAMCQFLPEERTGMAVGVVSVRARDDSSARSIALNHVHDAVDELTGFTALTKPFTSLAVSDVFSALRVSLVTLVTRSSDEATVHLPLPLPTEVVRPKSLFALLAQHAPASRIKALLGEASDGDLSPRIRFIGRAQQCRFENRNADAFLYYVIALEALLGKKDYRDSIGYQLRMRVAHLIGRSLDERREIEREVVHLYNIRSKLAHSGTRQVRPADVTNAGTYAVRSIGEALFSQSVKDFTNFAQLEGWFRERLLLGG